MPRLWLVGANLTRSRLRRCDLSGANLVGANLTNADLSAACLAHSSCCDAQFVEAKLVETDFMGADCNGAVFAGADVRRAKHLDTLAARSDALKPLLDELWPEPYRMVLSPDAERALVVHCESSVVCRTPDGLPLATLRGHAPAVWLSSDICVTTLGNAVYWWQIDQGQELARRQLPAEAQAVAACGDGGLAVGLADGSVCILGADFALINQLQAFDRPILHLCCSDDREWIGACTSDGLAMWHRASGRQCFRLDLEVGAYAHNVRLVFSGPHLMLAHETKAHKRVIREFYPDGREREHWVLPGYSHLEALSADGQWAMLHGGVIWDFRKGREIANFRPALSFLTSTERVLMGIADDQLQTWSLHGPTLICQHHVPAAIESCVRAGDDVLLRQGHLVARHSAEGRELWTRTFDAPFDKFSSSTDGRAIFLGTGNGRGVLLNGYTGEVSVGGWHTSRMIEEGNGFPSLEWDEYSWEQPFLANMRMDACAVSPTGRMLATAHADKLDWVEELLFPSGHHKNEESPHIRIWETTQGTELRRFADHISVCALAWTPDESGLITGDGAGQIALWNPVTGDLGWSVQQHDTQVIWCGVAAGNVISVSTTHCVLLDLANGGVLWRPKVDVPLSGAAGSPDGQWLALVTTQGKVDLWHLPTRHQHATFGHDVRMGCFAGDNQFHVVTGSCSVGIWQLPDLCEFKRLIRKPHGWLTFDLQSGNWFGRNLEREVYYIEPDAFRFDAALYPVGDFPERRIDPQ